MFSARTYVAVAALALALLPWPAHADSLVKHDPRGDAPTHLDVARVHYRNAPRLASVQIQVPGLQERGRVQVAFGVPNSDVGYFAIVRKRTDGSLSTRLIYSTVGESRRVNCRFNTTWRTDVGKIDVSVPQSCLKRISSARAYYMFVRTGGRTGDVTSPARSLRRG